MQRNEHSEARLSIQNLIASHSKSMTPSEKRLARVVSDDPTLIAFGTVSDLARRARTSRPSVVRFAAKLGFSGYAELQAWAQQDISQRLAIPSKRIRQHDPVGSMRAGVEAAVGAVFEELDEARLGTLSAPIAAARNVWILSGETSMAGAHVLFSGLSMLRPGVRLVLEHSMGRDLCGANPGDACIVLDFARYRRAPVTAARMLAEMGVELVVITDGPLSPLASLTPHWCELKIPAAGPFDSAVPPVIAAELLVARVATELGEAARDRIDRLESIWQRVGTYLEYTPRWDRSEEAGAPMRKKR